MFTDIPMSLGMRRSLAAYQSLAAQIEGVQTRIATGKRINSALDNPASFFTSSALRTRAASLNSLVDRISEAKGALQAATSGISTIRSLLTSAQSLASSALLSANTIVKVTGASTPVLTLGTTIASTGGSSTRLKAGDTITVSDGTTTATYTAVNNDTVQDILNAINGTANLTVDASLNASGHIELQATGPHSITIGGALNGSGTLVGVTGLTAGTTVFTANMTRTSYAQQFDAIRLQIDAAIQDAGFGSLNLLAGGSQTINLNETGTSTFSLAGVSLSSSALGVAASTHQFQLDSDITTAVANVTSALSSLEAQTANFGSNLAIIEARSEFNQTMIDALQSGADDLVLVDTNAESAILLALQARQKLAATMFSIVEPSDHAALRLFRSS